MVFNFSEYIYLIVLIINKLDIRIQSPEQVSVLTRVVARSISVSFSCKYIAPTFGLA